MNNEIQSSKEDLTMLLDSVAELFIKGYRNVPVQHLHHIEKEISNTYKLYSSLTEKLGLQNNIKYMSDLYFDEYMQKLYINKKMFGF